MSLNPTISFVVLFAASINGNAQVKGRVIDMETNRPVIGADIFINPKGSVKTDGKGYFVINEPFHSVTFSHMGYASRSLEAKEMKDTVWLLPKSHQLDEVVVTAFGPKVRFDTRSMTGKAWQYKKRDSGSLIGDFDFFSSFSFKKNKQAKRRRKIKEMHDKY